VRRRRSGPRSCSSCLWCSTRSFGGGSLGDSHVEGGPFGEIIGSVAQRGINAATIAQVTSFARVALSPRTSRVIVEVGTGH
jgi:hypothetical protein